jgi:hypothetical protein
MTLVGTNNVVIPITTGKIPPNAKYGLVYKQPGNKIKITLIELIILEVDKDDK